MRWKLGGPSGIATLLAALLSASHPGAAQPAAQPIAVIDPAPAAPGEVKLATELNEEIARVSVDLKLPNGRPHTGDMVVTHYRPAGPGPFPVVVFSHGRSPESRHEPARWRALPIARYWTRRGFAVVVPTRVGYGELGQAVDPETSGLCSDANFRPAVEAMTTQIARAVAFAGTLPWVDARNVVLAGVSYGGFATVAASAKPLPGIVGAINFAGGLGGNAKRRGDPCQGARVLAMAAEAGRQNRVPMLWLYAENDIYWGAEWPRRWFDAFTAAGGRATLASFPPLGEDGHKLMSGGFKLWRPAVDRFVERLGFKVPVAPTTLPASGFAALDAVDKVPHISAAARADAYPKFLAADIPRAFVISPSGAWAWRSGTDAIEVATSRCQINARTPCSLYAVDDRVVWKPQAR